VRGRGLEVEPKKFMQRPDRSGSIVPSRFKGRNNGDKKGMGNRNRIAVNNEEGEPKEWINPDLVDIWAS
jgi:hypothetical protein